MLVTNIFFHIMMSVKGVLSMTKFNSTSWADRYSSRSDMSLYLTHLTKSNDDMNALDVLIKILNEGRLIGSGKEGFISGADKAVCFQDVPIQSVVQNLTHEEKSYLDKKSFKVRYTGTGLMIPKPYAFKKGARPVIYETKEEAKKLFSDVKWRVVTLELNDAEEIIDWTHEREWHVKGDFEFALDNIVILLPSPSEYRYFIQHVNPEILQKISGIILLSKLVH